ncbi:MAG TPA: DinB family protein, partial [Candidatus Acidoferrales bacterium]|nr:DinB family protein [Candidatus Acidoferrales bacterium]
MDFWALLDDLAALPDRRLAEPWQWPGHLGQPQAGRDCLYRLLEAEQAAVAAAPPASEASRILALAQEAFRDLCGLLSGIEDADLDRPPGAGEWSLREVLAHVLLTERRYAFQVRYAARRKDSDPVQRVPRLELGAGDRQGGRRQWRDRLAGARQLSNRLARIADPALARPTRWAGYDVDIRFR